LADRGEPFWINVLQVIWIGAGLETTVNYHSRSVGFNSVAFLFRLWTFAGKLRANISHQWLCPWLNVFGVVFLEDLFMYHLLIEGLLFVR
jgi:hypothetical protein